MKYDVVIVGGGIVGLATAYNLVKKKPNIKLAIVEKENKVAAHQTGNNSGVIHSGIYYKPGSQKAINCIKGYDMLIAFAKEHNIPFEICGKIIVATELKELSALEKLYDRGIENGLKGLQYLTQAELLKEEPNAVGIKAIKVPQTGIIDYKVVSQKIHDSIINLGGEIMLNEAVLAIEQQPNSIAIKTSTRFLEAKLCINCAGLYCDKIAEMAGEKLDVKIIPFRGEYYYLKDDKKALLNNLIYPVPDENFPFLGVHFTRRISGEVEAGPNAVFSFKREGYKKTDFNLAEFAESIAWSGFRKVALKYWKTGLGEFYRSYNKSAFVQALQKLMPAIQQNDLIPAHAGVRAQACHKNGNLIDDFYFIEKQQTIHVLNAPSPAATSALSIGDTISNMAISKLH